MGLSSEGEYLMGVSMAHEARQSARRAFINRKINEILEEYRNNGQFISHAEAEDLAYRLARNYFSDD